MLWNLVWSVLIQTPHNQRDSVWIQAPESLLDQALCFG